MILLATIGLLTVGIAVMMQRGVPVQLFGAGVVGATVANTAAGISTVVAVPQYGRQGGPVRQLRWTVIITGAAPAAGSVTVNLEGNDVDPTNATEWFVIDQHVDVVTGTHFTDKIPQWVRQNIVAFGTGTVAGSIGVS